MILCGVHENPRSSAAVAYAVWLAQQLHMPLRLAPAYPRNELLAAAEAHRARLLIVACQDSDSGGDSRDGAQSLVKESPRPVIALSKRAALPWRAPHRAQRNARPLIVAGVDGSEASLAAAAEAADLTERMDSWLMLVHARSDQIPHGSSRFSVEYRLAGTDDGACRRLAQSVFPRLGRANGEAGARELFGDPVEALEAVASAEAAAMIAVGSRGLEPDRLVLGGSVSAALMRDASRPVLVLSPRAVARTIARLGARGAGERSPACS